MTTTTPTTARFAVLRPLGGSPRAQVCSVHATHLGAARHLSPGRVLGVVPDGTESLDNVPLTTVEEHLAAEARRVAGERCYVQVIGDTRATADVTVQTASDTDRRVARASVDVLLAALESLDDAAGFGAIMETLRTRRA